MNSSRRMTQRATQDSVRVPALDGPDKFTAPTLARSDSFRTALSVTDKTRNPSPIRRLIDPSVRRSTRSASPNKDKRSSMIIPTYSQQPSTPSEAGTSNSQTTPPKTITGSGQNIDSTTEAGILTALAAQERRVLELKEDLQKAENDLQTLKRQWAAHEATNRRNEGRRLQQMRPLSISSAKTVTNHDDTDGSSAWMYEEMERRKALLGNAKTSNRRVFSGSRQTKTLSLLSPENTHSETSAADVLVDTPETRRSREPVRQSNIPRESSTTPDLTWQPNDYHVASNAFIRRDSRSPHRSPQRDALVRTGKQVATDLRDGFWTFFEDLRQAAVGDEPRSGQEASAEQVKANALANSRKTSPGRRTRKQLSDKGHVECTDAGASFLKEHGLPEPTSITVSPKKSAKTRTPQKLVPLGRKVKDSPWDAWESPNEAYANSLVERSNSTVSAPGIESLGSPELLLHSSSSMSGASSTNATPRPVPGAEEQLQPQKHRDAIPWPTLSRLTPGQLVRSASNLMEEWERSLTPSPSAINSNGRGGDFYAGGHDGYLH